MEEHPIEEDGCLLLKIQQLKERNIIDVLQVEVNLRKRYLLVRKQTNENRR